MKIITTKSELENAIKNKEKHFIVKGDLAEKIEKGQKIKTLSKWSLGVLSAAIAGIAVAPATGGITGGLGLAAAGTVATLTGLEIAVIIAVVFLGVGLLKAIDKDYNIKFKGGKKEDGFDAEVEFIKK